MNLAGPIAFVALVVFSSNNAFAELRFNIALADDGHYRVGFDQLTGIDEELPSEQLYLYEQGKPVHIKVNDGGDGFFGSGDSFQFVGRRLSGERSWYNEYGRENIYRLHVSATGQKPNPPRNADVSERLIVEHLEQDKLRIALPHANQPDLAERWYWQRITQVANDSFNQPLGWSEVPNTLRISLTGLSYDQHASAADLPHHQAVIYLDGEPVGEVAWDGQEPTTIDINTSTLKQLKDSGALLEIHLPKRKIPGTGKQLVDAVLLNWIELEYSPLADIEATIPDRAGVRQLKVAPGWQTPDWIEKASEPAALTKTHRQADYLMISHPELLEALAPLAEFHRARGLSVDVVDVRSVFDEFNHGLPGPQAIQSFISHAWHHWRKPAPQMVLLVGDASWSREPDRDVTRHLVPTFQVMVEGHLAASDNGLVSVDGDDWRPDLAVGRLPAGDAGELTIMIDKILQHSSHSPGGQWRLRTSWISGHENQFQKISSEVSAIAAERGLTTELIFPKNLNTTEGQSRVVDVFDQGSALVHFLGHGGRFVWRTGPADLRGARDLFTDATVASLQENHALPLVLAMTCSSGPFDHPTTGSLAESFLLTPGRGAMGVLAASWRVRASQRFSTLLVESLLQTDKPIGVAIMEAKQRERRRSLVESYNLLGDPGIAINTQAAP